MGDLSCVPRPTLRLGIVRLSGVKPRLLFLCQNLPYPPDGGALIRSFHTLRLLSEAFDVTALCFYRASTRSTPETVAESVGGLTDHAAVSAFRIPQEHRRWRLIYDHLRSLLTGRVYTRFAYSSSAFRGELRRVLADQAFQIAHLDSLDLATYLDDVGQIPVVVSHHNAESQLLSRRAELESGLKAWYVGRQARLMAREERELCARVDLNLVVSPQDGELLSRLAPTGRYLLVTNGVDTSAFTPMLDRSPHGIVFVGGSTWFPNLDGMEYFVRQILPRIRDRRPEVTVTWVGRAPSQIRERFSSSGVTMAGYVDDIRAYVHRAACFIVPLRVGGGTRLKILDAWALGSAVVSTSQGAEGLECRHGDNVLIADGVADFSACVLSVLEDSDLRKGLERAGRKTVVRRYDWKIVGRGMKREYLSLVKNSRSTA